MHRTRLGFGVLVMVSLVAGGVAAQSRGQARGQAQLDGACDDCTESPYFFVEGASDGIEAFPLESTDVRANVGGVIADVTVTQVYRNDGQSPIHARYVFPASTRAAVHGMQMTIGSRRVVAKIKERMQATREFEAAKAAGKSASLLEQDRPNVFTMSVGNIMPGDRVTVELRYSELLVPTDGVYQFVYPTVVGPRYANHTDHARTDTTRFAATPYLHEGDAPPSTFNMTAEISSGAQIADIRSSSHLVDVRFDEPTLAHVTLHDPTQLGGNRDFILDYRLAGGAIQTGLLLYEGQRENHFLMMLQPPARVRPAAITAREYIFVLDVSGSMHGFPLDTAKALIGDLIAHLRPTDTFNVVLFAGDARLLSPGSLPATLPNVQRAIQLIDGQPGGGGTELEAALKTAVALPRGENVSRSVVLVTDGYIAQERGAFELIADHASDMNLFAFGIGSSVNRYLIEGLARTGQGEPFIVTDPASAADTAARFRQYIEAPVLTNVSVRFDGFDAYDVEPAKQADLFAQRPIVVFGKYRGPRAGQIVVRGQTAAGPYVSRMNVATTTPRPQNAALPLLWARARIARLSDFDASGNAPETVREVTSLGLTYSLLTEHTSFIAVLEAVRNPSGDATDVDQPSPLPLGVSDLAVADNDYAAGAEPEMFWLLVPMLLYAAWQLQRRRAAAVRL